MSKSPKPRTATAYAVRMLGTGSTDEKSLGELGQVAKRLAKKKASK